MERLQTNFLYLKYASFKGTLTTISSHYTSYLHILIIPSDLDIDVFLFKENKFDIKNECYITKKFTIGSNMPVVKPIKKEDVYEKLKLVFSDDSYKKNFVKGIFEDKYKELKREKDFDYELQIKELKEELKKAKEERFMVSNVNNTININTINNVNILQAYRDIEMKSLGNEYLGRISMTDFKDIFRRENDKDPPMDVVIGRAIAMIHFNPRSPENNNIFITERKNEPECMVFTDGRWIIGEKLENRLSSLMISVFYLIEKNNYTTKKHMNYEEQYLVKTLKEIALEYGGSRPSRFGVDKLLYSLTKTEVPKLIGSIEEERRMQEIRLKCVKKPK